MQWSRSNSIRLSKICICLFGLSGIATTVLFGSISTGIIRRRGMEESISLIYFSLSYGILLIPAYSALFCLYRLLDNIGKGEIFVGSNVKYLRNISWICFFAAGVSLISVSYYKPYMLLAVTVGFIGLILRIVKNVFEEAVHLKEENDFTI